MGISCLLDKELNKNFEVIPTVWDTVLADGTLTKLNALQEGIPQLLLGISIHHTEDWKYLIAVRSDKKDDTFEEYWIPACKWEIFEGRGAGHEPFPAAIGKASHCRMAPYVQLYICKFSGYRGIYQSRSTGGGL